MKSGGNNGDWGRGGRSGGTWEGERELQVESGNGKVIRKSNYVFLVSSQGRGLACQKKKSRNPIWILPPPIHYETIGG